MYPAARSARDRFILEHRGPRKPLDPWVYQNLIVENELSGHTVARTATIFLTGKECAWRCVMCDLWQYTTASDTPRGAIAAQIAAARAELRTRNETVTQLKLYNASNFFDPHAVPADDYHAIAASLAGIDRVVVESHPALIDDRIDMFLAALSGCRGGVPRLEVAMGLETANPQALEQLNKGISVEHFSKAAQALRVRGVALRVFLLISPPFIPSHLQDRWLAQSVETAFSCGATAVSLIPTRAGNGAMETLAAEGLYRPPRLNDIERSLELAFRASRSGRVFIDLWDLPRFAHCRYCFEPRLTRLQQMNVEQQPTPPVACTECGHGIAP